MSPILYSVYLYPYIYLSVFITICIHLYIYLYQCIKNRFYTRELKKLVNYFNCIEGKGEGLKKFTVLHKITRCLFLYIKISFLYIYLSICQSIFLLIHLSICQSIYLCELYIIYDPMIKSWWT